MLIILPGSLRQFYTFSRLEMSVQVCPDYSCLLEVIVSQVRLLGLYILDPNYTPYTWNFFIITLLSFSVYFVVEIFSLFNVTHFIDIVFCLATVGVFWQEVIKLFIFVQFRREFISVSVLFEEFYGRHRAIESHQKILDKYVHYSEIFFRVIRLFYLSAVFSALILPIVVTFTTGIKTLPFGFFLPFVDRFSTSGYLLNFAFVIWHVYLTQRLVIAGDSYFNIQLVVTMSQLDVLCEMIDDLDRMLNDDDRQPEEEEEEAIDRYISEICNEHVNHLRYAFWRDLMHYISEFPSLNLTIYDELYK